MTHRKKVLENFQKFISQEQLIRISIKSAYGLYFKELKKWQLGLLSMQDFSENHNKEFLRRTTNKICIVKHVYQKPRKKSIRNF